MSYEIFCITFTLYYKDISYRLTLNALMPLAQNMPGNLIIKVRPTTTLRHILNFLQHVWISYIWSSISLRLYWACRARTL